MAHVQYKLDLPPERQTPVRRFDPPTRLLDLTQTLTQSLNLPSVACREAPVRPPTARVFDTMDQLIGSVRLEAEADAPAYEAGGGDLPVESPEPQATDSGVVRLAQLDLDFRLMGGRDFPEIWDLRTLDEPPVVTDVIPEGVGDEFEIVTNRDDFNFIQVRVGGSCDLSFFDQDPAVGTRVVVELSEFSVLDNIQDSTSRIMLGIDEEGATLGAQIDVLKSCQERMELSVRLRFPRMSMFITGEQIDFFIASASSAIPVFPSDLIVDEPLAFQLFSISASNLHISAHFRLWLDVHLGDIEIDVPACSFFTLRGFDSLVGALAEF
jgi:hypothetical protein